MPFREQSQNKQNKLKTHVPKNLLRINEMKKESLSKASSIESQKFEEYYIWLEKHMPECFFKEIDPQQNRLIVHYLMGFSLQENFCQIMLKDEAFVLTLDAPDADIKILKNFNLHEIKNYQTFISDIPPPFPGVNKKLKIVFIHFISFTEEIEPKKPEDILSKETLKQIYAKLNEEDLNISEEKFYTLVCKMSSFFSPTLSIDQLVSTFKVIIRAHSRDHCQYEITTNEEWKKQKGESPSFRIVFAWRACPRHHFLLRLAKLIYRHHLKILKINATKIDPFSKNSILIISLELHGIKGKAAWEEADIPDFLQEIVTLKYFPDEDLIEKVFIEPELLRGNIGNLLRAMANFIHETLILFDINLYTYDNTIEGLCRHPELTVEICKAFELKFHPEKKDLEEYKNEKEKFLMLVNHLDTGSMLSDMRRKNILKQAIHFVDCTLKTNFYRKNKSALSFRLDPKYLNSIPYNHQEKFPEIPYGIFFIQGMHFIGFHIRFKDISRGGLRTVFLERQEQMSSEKNYAFSECYNLAYTQHKKNKDIPEGGSKGIIFLKSNKQILLEAQILKKELTSAGRKDAEVEEIISELKKEQKIQYLYQAQRAYIHSMLTLINCEDDGSLKASNIVDYWKKPEYIFLGPDENMHNHMIKWIANYSKKCGYKLGISFISSKPQMGMSHKKYGATSLGINVYMQEVLQHLKIDPKKDPFTVKMSGGPDGDVAGNQILNLYQQFPTTAKLLAITDISGTIFDPKGLDLSILSDLFFKSKPIAAYPPKKLSNGGFLLDLYTKKEQTACSTKTLCWRKEKEKLIENWLSGNDKNYLFKRHLHQVHSDIFIPAGGRPYTLNDQNFNDFIDSKGNPTSRAIIEGANLYLTPHARQKLEKLGTFIIMDSSANKGGVICSSMEILAGLLLTEEEFLNEKPQLIKEILAIISDKVRDEVQLLLKTHDVTKEPLTTLSEKISEKINTYTYELLDYLETITLSSHLEDPLIKVLLNFCPKLLAEKYHERLIQNLPTIYKKAIIACTIASHMVYTKGLKWQPSIVDILPMIT